MSKSLKNHVKFISNVFAIRTFPARKIFLFMRKSEKKKLPCHLRGRFYVKRHHRPY